ncbi:MAG TPA: ATP-binding protein [Candidatus Binatia bacterium]|nr:ATP-binding protein [Candidatus Binatia bacterium]
MNLITGKNNTCKTGVLEGLDILLAPHQMDFLPKIFRNGANLGDMRENYWKWLFHNRNTAQPVLISATGDEFGGFSVAVFLGPGPTPAGYIPRWSAGPLVIAVNDPASLLLLSGVTALSVRPTEPQQDALDYDRVVLKSGGEARIEALLRKIEPRLRTIRSISPLGAHLLYVDVGLKDKIPAAHLGQGFIRLLSIYAEIIASGKKVLLIDEFENGLHYSVLTEVWRGILNAVQQENVQVFATTHSYECIKAAHAAFSETAEYDFALHRLEEAKGEIQVTTFDKETLGAALGSNFEIR